MSVSDRAVCVFLAGVSLLLHGCGGGGGGDTTTTTVTTTTTLSPKPKTPPMTSKAAAALLNTQYTGFDETDDKSPLGVTLSWAGQVGSFYKNIYCSTQNNPLGKTGCFHGQADCRMSTALINHKVAINKTTGFVQPLMKRNTAYIFNQSVVESKWAKCSYLWDGATGNRLNGGCGDGRGELSCEKGKDSAFNNICASTGKTCTADDTEIKKAECKPYGPTVSPPSTHSGPEQCFFPEPSIDYHEQGNWQPGQSHMREMLKARVGFNSGRDWESFNIEKWNEVVLDENLLMPDIEEDPNGAIVAFAFVKSDPVSKTLAGQMRDEYCKYNKCTTVPLVAINTDIDASKGPFEDENAPMTCTPENKDPFSTGKELPCCSGLEKVLSGSHYVCKVKSAAAITV